MAGDLQDFTYDEIASRFYNLASVVAAKDAFAKPFADDIKNNFTMRYDPSLGKNQLVATGQSTTVENWINTCVAQTNDKMKSDGHKMQSNELRDYLCNWILNRVDQIFGDYVTKIPEDRKPAVEAAKSEVERLKKPLVMKKRSIMNEIWSLEAKLKHKIVGKGKIKEKIADLQKQVDEIDKCMIGLRQKVYDAAFPQEKQKQQQQQR